MTGPAAGEQRPIDSIQELRRLVPALLERINADPALALRAAANPLLAIEELGLSLTPAVRAEAERRIRFPKAARERLAQLEKTIFKHAGHAFDLQDPQALERVLFDELKLARPESPAGQPEPAAAAPAREFVDPLAGLAGSHPVIAPLLEFRRIQASQPPLAPRGLYERIRRGEVKAPVVRLRARLKGQTAEDG